MKQTFRVVLEVEVDPNEINGGMKNGNPGRWNWQGAIQSAVDIPNLAVRVEDCFVACCSDKIEWYQSDNNDGFSNFPAYFHDEECINYVDIEDDIEDEESEASLAFQSLLGSPIQSLNSLTVRSTSPVEAL